MYKGAKSFNPVPCKVKYRTSREKIPQFTMPWVVKETYASKKNTKDHKDFQDSRFLSHIHGTLPPYYRTYGTQLQISPDFSW